MKKFLYILCSLCLFATTADAQLFPDRHTTSPSDGWKSCVTTMNPNPDMGMSHWIMFDFQSPKSITDVKLWNHNDPANLTDGVATVSIDYSLNNTTWVNAGTFSVEQSEGSAFYEGEIIANLNGANMRYLVITATDNHGGTCYGFDEARFYIGQTVPIVLADFQGDCIDGEKKFTWNFADVSDFSSVELEWSTNGNNWEAVHKTSNPGKQINFQEYVTEYTDIRKVAGDNHFYRLKLIDINGDFKYSDIVSVACEVDENDIRIYPQPVSAEMSIDIELMEFANINYTVKNVLGQSILSGIFDAKIGFNRFTLEASDLTSGQYFLLLDINGQQVEKKFIKQ